MNDQAVIDELIDRFRAETETAGPSLEAATAIVAAAWPVLDAPSRAKLVVSGSRFMQDDDELLDASVSDELAARVRRASEYIRYVPSASADRAECSSEAIEYVDFVDPSRVNGLHPAAQRDLARSLKGSMGALDREPHDRGHDR